MRKRSLVYLMAAAIAINTPAYADETTTADITETVTSSEEDTAEETEEVPEETAEVSEEDTDSTAEDETETEPESKEPVSEDPVTEESEGIEDTTEETTEEETEPPYIAQTAPGEIDRDTVIIVKDRDIFNVYKELGIDYDLSEKTEEQAVAIRNQILYDLTTYTTYADINVYVNLDYDAVIADIDVGSDKWVTFTTPTIAGFDSVNTISGAAVMEYLAEHIQNLDIAHNIRFIFFPREFPSGYITSSYATYMIGGVAGGDRLFVYNLAAPSYCENAVKTSLSRHGTVFYATPKRFDTGVPAGLEGYYNLTYLERSLWWYENVSELNEFVGTRYYMTRAEQFRATDGHITGFCIDNLQLLADAYGITILETRLSDIYNALTEIVKDGSIFDKGLYSDETAPYVPATEPSATTPDEKDTQIQTENPSEESKESLTEETTEGEEETKPRGGSFENETTETPAEKGQTKGINPFIYFFGFFGIVIAAFIAAQIVLKKTKGISLIGQIKDIFRSGDTEKTERPEKSEKTQKTKKAKKEKKGDDF